MKSTILLLRVFEENYKSLFRIVYSYTYNIDDTMDILQETFIRAYMQYNSYKSKEDTLKLLMTISKNTAITYKKQNKTYDPLDMIGKVGATDIPSLDMFLKDLKALGSSVPIDLFNYVMMNVLGGVPLLEVSRKSTIPYERLRYWKEIIIKGLSRWIKSNSQS